MRTLFRRLTPGWIQDRLIPFERGLERLAADFCAGQRGRLVLDIGCAGRAYSPNCIGLDRRFESLRNYPGAKICADVHALPLRDAAADAICCSAAFHHFRHSRKALEEMRRCLSRRAALFLTVPDRFPQTAQADDYHRFSRQELVSLLPSDQWSVELRPIGGRFWTLSRLGLERCFAFLRGWRTSLFLVVLPVLGLFLPLSCFYLDRLDRRRKYTLGWHVVARKETA